MSTPNPDANRRHSVGLRAATSTPVRLWWAGARPKTLGVAVAPVLVGTAAGALGESIRWARAVAALVVALALQVGVNYANDYSDGVRGTDKDRRGPGATGRERPRVAGRGAQRGGDRVRASRRSSAACSRSS